MKRLSVLMSLIVFVAASLLAPAQARGVGYPRDAEAPYQTPVIGAAIRVGGYGAFVYHPDCERQIGCATFRLNPDDGFVSFEIRDTTGRPIHAEAYSSEEVGLGEFCGKTHRPLQLMPDARRVFVTILPGTCWDLTPSAPTKGVVHATFFKECGWPPRPC